MQSYCAKNKLILILSLIYFSFLRSYGQENIVFYPEFVSVCIGERWLCEEEEFLKIKNDSLPLSVNLVLNVENHTGKKLLFGSNSSSYYKGLEEYYYENNDGKIGWFLLINNNDTIPLLTYYSVINAYEEIDFMQITASIDELYQENDAVKRFFCNLPDIPALYIKYIYQYILSSELIYVPYVSDYERALGKYSEEEKSNIVYPMSPFSITYSKPLSLVILDCDEYYGPNSRYYYEGDEIIYVP